MPPQGKGMREDPFFNDLNNVFIPCRTVLEMEALLGPFLAVTNYDLIKDLPQTQPSSDQLAAALQMSENPAYAHIIDYFTNAVLPKLKPVVMYERDHHDAACRGNVSPYSKTRVWLFFALHNLKLKFLLVKGFFDRFQANQYVLDPLQDAGDNDSSSSAASVPLLTAFGDAYYTEYSAVLADMLPQKVMTAHVRELLANADAVTNAKVLQLYTYLSFDEDTNKIKYLMRGIKASLFVCNLMFAHLDVAHPFSREAGVVFDAEEVMVSQDFLPELVPAMSQRLAEHNVGQLQDLLHAFDQLMSVVLDGIDEAYAVASDGGICLEQPSLLYALHPLNRSRVAQSANVKSNSNR